MEVRTALQIIIPESSDIRVAIVETGDEKFVLEIEQGGHRVWVPLAEAKEFAQKLNLWAIDNAS